MKASGNLKTLLAAMGILAALALGIWAQKRVTGHPSGPKENTKCSLFFQKENLCASLTWIKHPVLVDAPTLKDRAEFALEFWKEDSQGNSERKRVDPPGQVVVSLWMPAMGHGSLPPKVRRDPNQPGVYQVENVLFSMGGEWEIWVSLLADNQAVDKAKFGYHLK